MLIVIRMAHYPEGAAAGVASYKTSVSQGRSFPLKRLSGLFPAPLHPPSTRLACSRGGRPIIVT